MKTVGVLTYARCLETRTQPQCSVSLCKTRFMDSATSKGDSIACQSRVARADNKIRKKLPVNTSEMLREKQYLSNTLSSAEAGCRIPFPRVVETFYAAQVPSFTPQAAKETGLSHSPWPMDLEYQSTSSSRLCSLQRVNDLVDRPTPAFPSSTLSLPLL
jgi:hypothetical protein